MTSSINDIQRTRCNRKARIARTSSSKMLTALSALVLSSYAFAEDSGWATIDRMDTWDTVNNVFLTRSHTCGKQPEIYQLGKGEDQYFALLLTAFSTGMWVNVSYTCKSDNRALIYAVRVQQ